jgi:hypothetical protein
VPVPAGVDTTIYATIDELKTRLRITDTTSDDELTDKLSVASRRIDEDTGRRFCADTSASARVYDLTHLTKLLVDDVSTATGLVVQTGDGTTWTTVQSSLYQLKPYNNLARGRAAWQIDRVNSSWPIGAMARVTAVWGWPSVPAPIHDATLLLAARLFRRKDSPDGVAGFSDMGVVRVGRWDPDYESNIGPYVRPEV